MNLKLEQISLLAFLSKLNNSYFFNVTKTLKLLNLLSRTAEITLFGKTGKIQPPGRF